MNLKKLTWLSPPDTCNSKNIMNTWQRAMKKKDWDTQSEDPLFIFAGSDSQLEKAFDLAAKDNVQVVCYFWGWPPGRFLNPNFVRHYQPKIEMLRRCEYLVVPTPLTQDQLAMFGIASNVCLPGIDINQVSKIKSDRIQKTIDIIAIGRLHPLKGFEDLIKAAQGTILKVLIIGEGDQKEELLNLAKKLDVDLEIISCSDEEKFMRIYQSKVLIAPSYYEGFGLPPLEALACNIPVFVRNIPIFTWLHQERGLANHVSFFSNIEELHHLLTKRIPEIDDLGCFLPILEDKFLIENAAKRLEVIFKEAANQGFKRQLGQKRRATNSPKKVSKIYDLEAERNWQESAYRFNPHWHRHWRVEYAVKELVGPEVMDLGTAYGSYAIRFAEAGFNVTAVDISQKYLDLTNYFAIKYNVDITTVYADAKNLDPINDKSFNSVWAGEIFEHIPEEELPEVFNEIHRVLKPEGRLIFSVPSGYHHDDPLHLNHWSFDSFRKLLETICPLKIIKLESIAEEGNEDSCIFGVCVKGGRK